MLLKQLTDRAVLLLGTAEVSVQIETGMRCSQWSLWLETRLVLQLVLY